MQISFIGMQVQEVDIKPSVKVVLKSDSQAIDEIVIVGYGTGKKLGAVVGSATTVSAKKLEAKPTMNAADALQGQVAGMQVFSSSGEPSSKSSMRVRGVSSLSAGTAPLYILDGAPVSNDVFTSINSNDIESITILKDASSTSIYGARAANGVIFITTKRGKTNEKASVTIRGQYGISQLPNFNEDMMNANEFLQFSEMYNPNLANDQSFQTRKALIQKYGLNMDWKDYILKDNVPVYSLDANISGAVGSTNYYISAGHFDQEGMAPNSNMTRENFRMNLNSKINDWISIGANAAVSYHDYSTTSAVSGSDGSLLLVSPFVLAQFGRPDEFPYAIIENADGTWSQGERYNAFPLSGIHNPWVQFDNSNVKREQIVGNLNTFVQLNPLPGLTIRAAQAFEGYVYKGRSVEDPHDFLNKENGSVSEAFQRGGSWTFTNTVEYKKNFKVDHSMTLLAGQEAITYSTDKFSVAGSGITDSRLTQVSNILTSTLSAAGAKEEYVYNSYFARGEYNYKEKYYIDASIRTDGSSKFSKDHRYATFYSVGAMYNITNEEFMSDIDWINDLRVKFSYGTTGNSSLPSNYLSLGTITGGSKYNYGGNSGWVIGNAGNQDLSWETVKNLNIGLSTTLFDRLDLSIEYYQKKTVDMLMKVPYSYTTAHSSGWGNVGSMMNRGVDIEASVKILDTNDFSWDVYANLNYNKAEILSLFNGLDEYVIPNTGLKYKVGHDPYEYYTVLWAGVDPRDGAAMWYDLNGNKTKTFSESNSQFTGLNQIAPCSGGFGTNFTWKGLSVVADFSWIGERYILHNERFFTENPANGSTINLSKEMLTMWQKPGDITNVPRKGIETQFDSKYYENAAFVRLKNLTVSYTLPKSIMKKTKIMENLRVFATGRNLLTFTKFEGIDPEVDSNVAMANYPNPRQYTFGLEIKF